MDESNISVDDPKEWVQIISDYDTAFSEWSSRNKKILKLYRDDHNTGNDTTARTSRFNILWSIVQTVSPAVFSKVPKAEITRRYKDSDQIGRVAGIILERVLRYELEEEPDFKDSLELCVHDRFLGGRGTAWVRLDHDGVDDESPVDYVHWSDFGHSIARIWADVTLVWRKVYMDRESLIERFGDKAEDIPLSLVRKDSDDKETSIAQAVIYEIWNKSTKKVLWVCKDSPGKILDIQDDPLKLRGFFPCPKPLFATTTSDTLVPVPDYGIYQHQARNLDELSERIDGLINALKVRGVYDAAVPELMRLFSEDNENVLIPSSNWNAFSEKNGLKGSVELVDLAPIAVALNEAYKAMDQLKQQVYDLTGISDIVRGSTNPNETAFAQQLKGQYVSLRLKAMQKKVAEFAQEILRIKAQVICKHYSPETIARIAEVDQLTLEDPMIVQQAIQLLTDDPLLKFRINVAADSMLQLDDEQERKESIEFLGTVGQFIEKAVQMVEVDPGLAALAVAMLRWAVVKFKVGRTLEGQIEQTILQLEQKAAQPKQPPPNPEMIRAQTEGQKLQSQMQIEKMKITQDANASEMRLQMEKERDTMASQASAFTKRLEVESAALLARQQQEHEQTMELMRLEFEQWKAELDNSTKLTVAEISAKTALSTAAMSASDTDSSEEGE